MLYVKSMMRSSKNKRVSAKNVMIQTIQMRSNNLLNNNLDLVGLLWLISKWKKIFSSPCFLVAKIIFKRRANKLKKKQSSSDIFI